MKKEKMVILKMVNDGKITVDEAVKLIESIRGSKTFSAGEVFDNVRDKVCDIVEEAKPVVKKCADKAVEVSEEMYTKGKAKMEEYKNKAKNSDIIDEVVVEPVSDVADAVKDVTEEIKDVAEEIAEELKEDK